MIRFLITATFVVLFLILSMPLMLAEWIIGKFNMDVKSRSSLAIVNWAFRCVAFLSGTKLIVKGRENIPDDRAVLYVGNHRSFFDIVLTYPLVKGPTGYVAKKEMEKVPLLSIWMKDLHCLFLDRDNIKEGMEKKFKSTMRKCYTGLGIVMLLNSCVSFLQSYLYTVKDGEVVAKQDLGSWAFLTPTLFNVLIYVFLGLTIVGIVLMAVLMRRFVDKEAEKRARTESDPRAQRQAGHTLPVDAFDFDDEDEAENTENEKEND